MDAVAALICATPGSRHFRLEELPSDLIDHIFNIVNPHYFYLLLVLRCVCKRLWKKIPLTINTRLADVGASFSGDLPVLKWIYNTIGIAHPESCMVAADATGCTPVRMYLRRYLGFKLRQTWVEYLRFQAPMDYMTRSIPRDRLIPYVFDRLTELNIATYLNHGTGATKLDDTNVTEFENILRGYSPVMSDAQLAQLAKFITPAIVGQPVLRGPRSSLVRKQALLNTDPVLLHLLLKTAQHEFSQIPDLELTAAK